MRTIDLLLAELDREGDRSRRALECAPDGKFDWKPHDKSMSFGYLTGMIATIPSWIAMAVRLNELDIKPKEGPTQAPQRMDSSGELIKALAGSLADAKSALSGTTDACLETPWRLLESGATVMEQPRHVIIADTLNHWAHHRGQMTVYLRLMGARVPALFGPSADEHRF